MRLPIFSTRPLLGVMRRMRMVRLIATVALALALSGSYWGVVQSVAWARMFATYTQEAGVTEGLRKTFDGNAPCELCRLVRKGQQEEKRQERQTAPNVEITALIQQANLPFTNVVRPLLGALPVKDALAESLRAQPPTPPPRGLFAVS